MVKDEDYFIQKMRERVLAYHKRSSSAEISGAEDIFKPDVQKERITEAVKQAKENRGKQIRETGDLSLIHILCAGTREKPQPPSDSPGDKYTGGGWGGGGDVVGPEC